MIRITVPEDTKFKDSMPVLKTLYQTKGVKKQGDFWQVEIDLDHIMNIFSFRNKEEKENYLRKVENIVNGIYWYNGHKKYHVEDQPDIRLVRLLDTVLSYLALDISADNIVVFMQQNQERPRKKQGHYDQQDPQDPQDPQDYIPHQQYREYKRLMRKSKNMSPVVAQQQTSQGAQENINFAQAIDAILAGEQEDF